MRDKKTVILMIIALSLLAAGCSTGAKEKSGNLKKVERMETEKILTVDELIRLSGITEADYRDVDLQQFIEDYAITEENVESLNIKLLLENYDGEEDVSDIFAGTAQERKDDFTTGVAAIAFYENVNTGTECVYYDLAAKERYRAADCFLFSDLDQTEAEPYGDGEMLIDKMDSLGVFSWENSSDPEYMEDAQSMELAVKYEDGTVFHVSSTGILSQLLPDTYTEIRTLLLG
ncbi:hypothetical protein [Lachnoclostridium sp. An76]|uniref:hypothetical protein n=1 Tax=Lachnoclostridium sp. An76 TaxID=1965654 RepID=UPI000B37CB4C|nr:hypothetical protein [Lachnoclostridium sp. An76]OUN34567.1 hypothetical protein B5G27_07370 [Lachnoclostridium sp. An76]